MPGTPFSPSCSKVRNDQARLIAARLELHLLELENEVQRRVGAVTKVADVGTSACLKYLLGLVDVGLYRFRGKQTGDAVAHGVLAQRMPEILGDLRLWIGKVHVTRRVGLQLLPMGHHVGQNLFDGALPPEGALPTDVRENLVVARRCLHLLDGDALAHGLDDPPGILGCGGG